MEHKDAPVDIRISATDGAEVAFEMTVVHQVESNLCEPFHLKRIHFVLRLKSTA